VEKKLYAFYYNSECFVDFLVNYWEQFTKLTPKWVVEWKEEGLGVKEFPATAPPAIREELTKFFTKYIGECENVLMENIEVHVDDSAVDKGVRAGVEGQFADGGGV
jgi:hypothetical protein